MSKQLTLLDAMLGTVNKRDDFLARIEGLVDWRALTDLLAKVEYRNEVGRPAVPAMVLFRMLLVQAFYNLSDTDTEVQVADRYSFRRFVGLQIDERVPDETSLVRFRERIREAGLTDKLLPTVMQQIEAKGLVVKRATLVDATLVKAAVRPPQKGTPSKDGDATFTVKNDTPHFGYKAHVSVDADSHLVRRAVMTTASVHDSRMLKAVVPDDDSKVFADKAYDSAEAREWLGERAFLMHRARRNRPLDVLHDKFNRVAAAIRCRVETIFGHQKRSQGFERVRYRGLAACNLELQLRMIAWNLLRVSNMAA